MGERRGTKALELWCKRITDGYPSVNVQNMTTSWRDGLAFCAMIHHFRPDLIDFSSLNKDNIYGNNELAFRTAEQHLGIPALLDAEDMASCSVPDRLSILTYLSQFYQVFGGSSSNRLALNRTPSSSNDRIESVSESPQPKANSRLGMRKDLCVSCNLPIFLAEKLMIARNAFHRSCFRCTRCHLQLTPGNYYETKEGQYCCEACPIDEVSAVILLEALSDEENNNRRSLQSVQQEAKEDDDKANNKFDEMIIMINNKIDELTSECEEEQASSPDAIQKRDSRANNAFDVVECRRTKNIEDLENPNKRSTFILKKNNLSVNEHTIKESKLVQHQLRLSERESISKSECELESKSVSRVDDYYIQKNQSIYKNDYPKDLNPFASNNDKNTEVSSNLEHQSKERSINPFDSINEETMSDETDQSSKLVLKLKSQESTEMPIKRLLEAPQINLNPFWSDDERENSLDSKSETKSKLPPVPKLRTLRHSDVDEDLLPYSKLNLTSISIHSSNTSITSSCSTITPPGTYRKKKPAPPPPPIQHQSYEMSSKSVTINSDLSLSPKHQFRMRKSKLAPAPPFRLRISRWKHNTSDLLDEPPDPRDPDPRDPDPDNDRIKQKHHLWNKEKSSKDKANRNTQNYSCTEPSTYLVYPADKSIEGKWKRKKGPAPLRPVPLKRKIKVISMKDIKLELDQIEMQHQGLEKQGVRLEQIIRNKCESDTASGEGLDLEELVLDLFTLVNEKNELFRKQTELMLLKRQQRLEEEHADIEYQVRCLLTQPEATKTDFDKQREEILIRRLVEIVEKRNEIVECLEMDRKREIEEDHSIHKEMDLYAATKSKLNVNLTDKSCPLKLKKGQIKIKKLKKNNKKDADKDVDEAEAKLERHNLRKWF